MNYPANRPDPDDPGGLGAEESGIERTGPTQWLLVAIQKGGRLAEIGPYYDSPNDLVTLHFLPGWGHGPSAAYLSRPGRRKAPCGGRPSARS